MSFLLLSFRLNAAVNEDDSDNSILMMGILLTRSVDVHVDKRLRFGRGAPKLYGARSSVHRRAVKGILMTTSSILAVSN